MLLNEIINEVGMTKRAVKYYEEKGLLSVDKDSNGYRNYSAQDVETLKKISVYRKLGIGIKDIQYHEYETASCKRVVRTEFAAESRQSTLRLK